jgi:hypothetical protein
MKKAENPLQLLSLTKYITKQIYAKAEKQYIPDEKIKDKHRRND